MSPEILASNIIQFSDGGRANIVKKIIKRVSPALKVLLFTFLFIMSTDLTPEYSSLIICKPIRPSMKGSNTFIIPGKKDVKFKSKKLLKKTSKILKNIDPWKV